MSYTDAMAGFVVIVIIVLALAIWGVVAYNRLVRLRNRTDNAWAQIDVQLRRRHDLIPNLVETVKGYASHERGTLEAVVEARNAAVAAGDIAEKAHAENLLTGALRQLFALAEAYPELRASENFRSLQQQLAETENKIAVSRQIYNDATLTFNNAAQTVPTNVIANLAGFSPRPYFEVEEDARSVPQIDF